MNLGPLIEGIAQDADFEAQMRHCRVEPTIVQDCTVMGSEILLHRAIENIVRNAIRYTREGTNVQVQLEPIMGADSPQAIIQVVDHGPGVPEELLGKLFRPFYRVDDARGRQTGGVGLGLAIAERAIRLHGGTVIAHNRPEGGLIVEIHLPRSSGGSTAEMSRTPASNEASGSHCSITEKLKTGNFLVAPGFKLADEVCSSWVFPDTQMGSV